MHYQLRAFEDGGVSSAGMSMKSRMETRNNTTQILQILHRCIWGLTCFWSQTQVEVLKFSGGSVLAALEVAAGCILYFRPCNEPAAFLCSSFNLQCIQIKQNNKNGSFRKTQGKVHCFSFNSIQYDCLRK